MDEPNLKKLNNPPLFLSFMQFDLKLQLQRCQLKK